MNSQKQPMHLRRSAITALLLPITWIFAWVIGCFFPGTTDGDTGYAWLPILVAIPMLFMMVVLFLLGLIRKPKMYAIITMLVVWVTFLPSLIVGYTETTIFYGTIIGLVFASAAFLTAMPAMRLYKSIK